MDNTPALATELPEASARSRRGDRACAWCGRPVEEGSTGRRKLYCRRSCRQRAYEERHSLEQKGLPEGSVVLSAAEADDLLDRIYTVRAAAEDLATALGEGADTDELKGLTADLVTLARTAERLR